MVLPPILGATALEVVDLIREPALMSSVSATALVAAALAAFLSGLWACQTMINLVKRNGFIGFAIYCGVVGVLAIGLSWI